MSADSRIRRSLSPLPEIDRLLRRIRCQIEFGRAIDDGRFTAALDRAEAAYKSNRTYKTFIEFEIAVKEAESQLTEIASEAKTFTIHLIGHGHIDMNWMWSWPETCATTHDTFASVLSLMEEYPELTYTQSQASVYAIIEKYHPAMFEQIKQRVREGRWEPAAVHWVEGDKNLASGESLAHHLLYTRQYFQEKFDLAPEDITVDWEPDTFGHCNTLPGILKQGGVKYYYCCRPGGGQEHLRVGQERPPMFWWESPDGSRVLVCKETTWYNSYVEIGDNFALPAAAFWKKTGLRDWMNVYGIGNHGGGPTRDEIDYFLETRDWPCWPTVEFGTAQKWFEKVEPQCADLPVLDHELNFEFTGCYTSQSAIKKANRYGENYCVEAETLSVISDRLSGGGSQTTDNRSLLRDAWINVLFNQFHDILPGSGVAATRNHALGLFQETGAITGAIKRNALQAIADNLDTASLLPDTPDGLDERSAMNCAGLSGDRSPHSKGLNHEFEAGAGQGAGESGISRASGGGKRFRPIMIFNPCAWERSEMVTVSLYDLEKDIPDDGIVALDEKGDAYPTLNVTGAIGGTHDWGHRRTDLLFYANDIPALGYKVFLFCEGEATVDIGEVKTIDEVTFETASLSLQLEKFGSGLSSVGLRSLEADLGSAYEPFGSWEYVTEWPTGMSSWLLGGNRSKGPAKLKDDERTYLQTKQFRVLGNRKNEATDRRTGSSFAILGSNQMSVPGTSSTVTVRTLVSGQQPRVDFTAEIDWREIGDASKGIPGLVIDFENSVYGVEEETTRTFETPFGIVERAGDQGNEVPSLRFVSTSGEVDNDQVAGFTLLQDCKYGHAGESGALQLRVLRSSYDPDHAPEIAKSTLRYAVVFHDTQPSNADLVRLGAAFNHPLMVVPTRLQSGEGNTIRSFVKVDTEDVVLSTLKAAEDGSGLVVRLVNYSGSAVSASVTFDPGFVEGIRAAHVADLMERSIEGNAKWSDNKLTVLIGSDSFVTVLLRKGS